MGKPLRVLYIEDSAGDAALINRLLEQAGYDVSAQRVETRPEMQAALDGGAWDVVICDYRLPQFDARAALLLLQESGRDLPFLVVSGTIGEDVAVAMMKHGAHDYVRKDNLARLVPAVEREIKEAQARRVHRAAEAALRESEQRWQFALEGSGAGVWDWNVETGECYFSRQWKTLMGYEEDEECPPVAEWRNRLHPDDEQSTMAAARAHLEGQASSFVSEHRLRCKDGTYKWVLARGKVVRRSTDGKPLRMIGTHTDMTEIRQAEEERKNLQAEFLHAQKMESIGRLAGGIAHDFNNLLTVMNGYSALALRKVQPDDPLRSSLEEIHRAGDRAAALVRQLLAFGRKQVLKRGVLDVNEVIREMEKTTLRLMGDDVEVITSLAPSLRAVVADRHQVEQVIMNLMVNARDAMPRGGMLIIETGQSWQEGFCKQSQTEIVPGIYVRITMQDTGSGMDEDTCAHLFEPFFTTKEVGKGTGLGLPVVQGIVAQSGGHITFESRLGKGTAFHVYLPTVEQQADLPAPEQASPPRGSETILVVEDRMAVRKFTVAALESQGYRVLDAAGAEEALALLESAEPALLLTDLVMPKVSGPELAARALALHPRMKLLYMSGYSGSTLAGHEDVMTNAAFIQKPFTAELLATKVRDVLESQPEAARVLVVDDDASVRRFLRFVLEQAGYEIAEAADGREALRHVSKSGTDLVITDLVMPEQEGIETIQALRRDYPEIAVIAISGAKAGAYLRIASPLGVRAALAKPVDPDTLLAEVRNALKKHS